MSCVCLFRDATVRERSLLVYGRSLDRSEMQRNAKFYCNEWRPSRRPRGALSLKYRSCGQDRVAACAIRLIVGQRRKCLISVRIVRSFIAPAAAAAASPKCKHRRTASRANCPFVATPSGAIELSSPSPSSIFQAQSSLQLNEDTLNGGQQRPK